LIQALDLGYDDSLSNYAFSFHLRRYIKAHLLARDEAEGFTGPSTKVSKAGAFTRPLSRAT